MENEKRNWGKRYLKSSCMLVLALLVFCSGMKDFVSVQRAQAAVVELQENSVTLKDAKIFWKNNKEREDGTDFCFVWNGKIQEIKNLEYPVQTTAKVIGVLGMASLYEEEGSALEENDKNGCIIDQNTAVTLFGSRKCEGSEVMISDKKYQVRKVASWKQHIVLIRPETTDQSCDQVLIRCKEGQSLESAASGFLMESGLSGTLVDDSWLDVYVPLGPMLFLLLFAGFSMKKIKKMHLRRKYLELGLKIAISCVCLVFCVRLLGQIPKDWLPDRWSDFSFWTARFQKTKEAFGWYTMVPKTIGQITRLLKGTVCALKCILASLILCLVRN